MMKCDQKDSPCQKAHTMVLVCSSRVGTDCTLLMVFRKGLWAQPKHQDPLAQPMHTLGEAAGLMEGVKGTELSLQDETGSVLPMIGSVLRYKGSVGNRSKYRLDHLQLEMEHQYLEMGLQYLARPEAKVGGKSERDVEDQ